MNKLFKGVKLIRVVEDDMDYDDYSKKIAISLIRNPGSRPTITSDYKNFKGHIFYIWINETNKKYQKVEYPWDIRELNPIGIGVIHFFNNKNYAPELVEKLEPIIVDIHNDLISE